MTVLYLVRHGETAWNRERRWQGQQDLELTPLGAAQARAAANRLAPEGLTALYSSDLRRAWQTAQAIAEACGLEPVSEPDLREVDVGSWAGLTPQEVLARFPEGHARWFAGGTGWEDGETYAEMAARSLAAAERICAAHAGAEERVGLVCHGGVIRALAMHALGLPAGERWRFAAGPNGTLTTIDARPGRWVLLSYNDAGHVAGLLVESVARTQQREPGNEPRVRRA
jgi:probable phosphoglycerate mutase